MSKQKANDTVSGLKRDSKIIMSELDRWVESLGNGKYNPADFKPLGALALYPDYSIQQVRSEINGLVDEIISRGLSGTILEIGLGHYGSTHFLWRLLFERVITIEKAPERCRAFACNYSKFYNGVWPTENDHSSFVFGPSSDANVVRKTYNAVRPQIDMLFIDGDHSYQGILCDWLLYHNLVRKGGIVAFHDCATDTPEQSEVPGFLEKLEKGNIDGNKYQLHRIVHSKHLGIAFYEYI